MSSLNTEKVKNRIWQYILLFFGLWIIFLDLHNSSRIGGTDSHTMMEIAATILALVVGIISLVRYYTVKNSIFLLIGLGFLGTGILDFYHALVTSSLLRQIMPSPPEALIPWSWNASRVFLSITMLASCWGSELDRKPREKRKSSEIQISVITLGMTIVCLIFFSFYPLPRAYYPELFFGRPEEFIPAALLFLALILFLKKGQWKVGYFEHWVIISLIIGFMGQAAFMSLSFTLFDIMFEVAHILKIASYICILIGLLYGIVSVFKKTNQLTEALQLMNLVADLSEKENENKVFLQKIITEVCKFMNWPVGHIYYTQGNTMIPSDIWHISEGREFDIFKEVTMETTFKNGTGLPGRVLKSKKSEWIKDVTQDLNFPRAKLAKNIGVKAGLCFPIIVNGKVEMVMEYYADKAIDPDEDLIVTMSNLGALIGSIIEKQGREKFIKDQKFALDQHAIVAMTDVAGKIIYVNDKFCDISKFSREELIGQDHRIINSGYHPKEFMTDLWRTIASGKVWSGEIKNKAKDGTYYWVDTTIIPFLNSDGKPHQYTAIRADITDRKQIEIDLAEQNKKLNTTKTAMVNMLNDLNSSNTQLASKTEELGRSNSELEQFAYVASHDLQEPLRKVISFGDLLKEECADQLSEDGLLYMDRMQSGSMRMKSLIEALLEYSRVTTKAKPYVDVDLNEVVAEAMNNLELRVKDTNAVVEIDDLPLIRGDRIQMLQLFQNLIGNALKYKREGVTPHVSVRFSPDENKYFKVSIQDNGIGFDQKYAEQVFVPFKRLVGKTEFEGTGIGLAICQKIVLRHEGTISVKSVEGEGSNFILHLPLKAYYREEK